MHLKQSKMAHKLENIKARKGHGSHGPYVFVTATIENKKVCKVMSPEEYQQFLEQTR